ncbi:hypothetical protein OROMI_003203 [Orobanche minor]
MKSRNDQKLLQLFGCPAHKSPNDSVLTSDDSLEHHLFNGLPSCGGSKRIF